MVQFKRCSAILVTWVRNVQSLKNTGTDWRSYTKSSLIHSDHHPFTRVSESGAPTMETVAIFDSPGKGRGLKATKEFWAGDLIFSEASIAAVVFDR